jgi:hypothetical protein
VTAIDTPSVTQALRRAAVAAVLAPSIHNTQPWSFVLTRGALEIHADPSRRLRVLDPQGRQLVISVGCAVFNARAELAQLGYDAKIERLPYGPESTLIARITAQSGAYDVVLAGLSGVLHDRHTNRREFLPDVIPETLVEELIAAAVAEHCILSPVVSEDHRALVARLTQQADTMLNGDAAYRAELRAWITDDPARMDGLTSAAIPHVDGNSHQNVPIRDFDTRGDGSIPAAGENNDECLLLLSTRDDSPLAWVRAGEALERILLEITRAGFMASPMTQLVEVPRTRVELRLATGASTYPHVILRVGRAAPTPATRRRRLVDMIEFGGDYHDDPQPTI